LTRPALPQTNGPDPAATTGAREDRAGIDVERRRGMLP